VEYFNPVSMLCMTDMTPSSLVTAVAPRTGKIYKNRLSAFKRGENSLQNGILHFVFKFVNRQKSCFKVRIFTGETEQGLAHVWNNKYYSNTLFSCH